MEHFNLDAILSVGYRVNSKRGTQFRIWANNVLKEYLFKGYAINDKVHRLETKIDKLEGVLNTISLQLKTKEHPIQGIFFDGQIFDAYVFLTSIIKEAKQNIILIDNYIDETVLVLLSKRNENVKATIYTKSISPQLRLDLEKHNSQYPEIKVEILVEAHDRFLLLDEKELYHIGASLKDLGKKWFAFSKMNSMAKDILLKLKNGKSAM